MKLRALLLAVLVATPLLAISQTWQTTGSLNHARRILRMTALNNSTVLATGGWSENMEAQSSCEIYDPLTASWSLTGSMQVGRAVHTITLLTNGNVVAIGGDMGGGQTDVVEIYDPLTGLWTSRGHLVMARQNHTASLLQDGTILVAGGVSESMSIASCEIYDPATGQSRAVASMNQVHNEHQATTLSTGEVMVSGGRQGGSDGYYLTECEIYNPVLDAWRVVSPMQQARMQAVLVQFHDNSILAAGGRNTPSSSAPGSELYDMNTNTWTATDSMKMPCTWSGNVLFPDDRYMITGGMIDGDWSNALGGITTHTCEWYDKTAAQWYFAPEMNEQRAQHGAVYLHQEVNGDLPLELILVAGGNHNDASVTATAEVLDVRLPALEFYMGHQNTLAVQSASHNIVPTLMTIAGNTSASPVAMFNASGNDGVTIQLTSTDCRVLATRVYNNFAAGPQQIAINVSGLPQGMYFVRMLDGAKSGFAKLMVLR